MAATREQDISRRSLCLPFFQFLLVYLHFRRRRSSEEDSGDEEEERRIKAYNGGDRMKK